VVELTSLSPCAGLLPVSHGATRLEETDLGMLTVLAPLQGRQKALSDALSASHGVAYPEPNDTSTGQNVQAIWFGRDAALLVGPAPQAGLRDHAAVTDQTDAWAAVTLTGSGAEDVLARVAPVDMRAAHFPEGATARTLVNHMNASITRVGADAFLILVFRSMAQTLVEELAEAMEAVAARG